MGTTYSGIIMAFVRVKWRNTKNGRRGYRQLVESYREGGKVKQRVLEHLGPVGSVGTTSHQVGTTKKTETRVDLEKLHAKQIDKMNLAELRLIARRYDVSSGGIKKGVLLSRIKKAIKKETGSNEFVNVPFGSVTQIHHEEGDEYAIDIIDKDVEPMTDVEFERMDAGQFAIKQKTLMGEEEAVIINIYDSDASMKRKAAEAKEVRDQEKLIKKLKGENKKLKITQNTLKKTMTPKTFESSLKKEFDLINSTERKGGTVPINDLYHEMKGKISKKQFREQLIRLEGERKIDLQTASDHKLVKDRSGSFTVDHKGRIVEYDDQHPTNRGLINYVVWRR